MSQAQMKLKVHRDKWIPGDKNAAITILAIQKYDDHVRHNVEMQEQRVISKNYNLKL